ncbi:hypothetical protein AQI96_01090 [Streptomyces canus]|nr:hypothetical protein AQI96_01090 [Streptomyces canus]
MACDDTTRDNVVEDSVRDSTASTDNDVNSVGASGWTVGGGGGTVQFGNEVVARAPCRNVAGADRDPDATYVFAPKPFKAPEGKNSTDPTLPQNTALHVFTLAVS